MTEELPIYKCHKLVRAAKVIQWSRAPGDEEPYVLTLDTGAVVKVPASRVPANQTPADGYYIRYEDGYESWSPKDVFEAGYTREPADFRDRVVAEHADVSSKLARLEAFIQTPKFAALPWLDRTLMKLQAVLMSGYADVLKERIDTFKPTNAA